MSDQVMEFINAQVGDNFNAKFEALVLRCMWELPAKEEELKRLEQRIVQERKKLYDMSAQAGKLEATIRQLIPQIQRLEQSIAKEVHNWDL